MKLFVIAVALGFCSLAPMLCAEEIKIGTRVVVIRDKAELQVSGKTSGAAMECSVFTVDDVQGPWLWIKSQQAYLKRADVIPFSEAIDYYTRKLEKNRTSEAYWNRAQIWRLKGELDIAISDVNEAIRLNPNESAWYVKRGKLRSDKGDFDSAVSDYGEAIRLNPKKYDAYALRAHLWKAKSENDKAIADFTEAIRITNPEERTGVFSDVDSPDLDSLRMVNARASIYVDRGLSHKAKRDFDKALADFGEAIRLDPNYEQAYANRGDVWRDKDNLEKAVADYTQAIQLAPHRLVTYDARGGALTCPPFLYQCL